MRANTVEHRMRMKLLEAIGLVGDMRTIVETMPAAERASIERDLDRMQSAAHSLLERIETREETPTH